MNIISAWILTIVYSIHLSQAAGTTYTICEQLSGGVALFSLQCCSSTSGGVLYIPATSVGMWSAVETTITSFYDGETVLTISSYSVQTSLFFSLLPGKVMACTAASPWQMAYGGDCTGVSGPLLSGYQTKFTTSLTNTFVTVLSPIPSATITSTVVENGSIVTESVCEGSDGVLTSYTTGPVPGTTTVMSCPP